MVNFSPMNHFLTLCILTLAQTGNVLCEFYCQIGLRTNYTTEERVQVTIAPGTVTGLVYQSNSGYKAQVFQGVPFATQQRFEYSVPLTRFPTNPVDGTKTQKICYQFGGIGFPTKDVETEDCLFLTILAPYQAATPGPYPVIVHIHGGAFILGSGKMDRMDGVIDAYVGKDIVFVSLQYRLGPLGFLYNRMGPQNLGLYDQHAALKFIIDNIAGFGGDPNKITLMGGSAGAVSISYLYALNPAPRVQGAIMMSGTELMLESIGDTQVITATHMLADIMGCGTAPNIAMCLRNADVKQIQNAVNQISQIYTGISELCARFLPVADGRIVQQNKSVGLMNIRGNVLVGACSDEGTGLTWMREIFQTPNKTRDRVWLMKHLNTMYNCMPPINQKGLVTALTVYQYLDKTELRDNNSLDVIRAFDDVLGDANFVAPAMKTAKTVAMNRENKAWLYKFSYFRPEKFQEPLKGFHVRGPGHGGDISYAFQQIGMGVSKNYTFDEMDCRVSENYTRAFTDFAKTGYLQWPALNQYPGSEYYMEFNQTTTVRQNYNNPANAFWNILIPEVDTCAKGLTIDDHKIVAKCGIPRKWTEGLERILLAN